MSTIRIFIGSDDRQSLAAKVLEYSLHKHTAQKLSIQHLHNPSHEMPIHRENWPRTGFSFARFLIPQLCEYKGRAIYLDADMLVFSDIRELWDWSLHGKGLVCARARHTPSGWDSRSGFIHGAQMSVLVMDCAKVRWDIQTIIGDLNEKKISYDNLMSRPYGLDATEWEAGLPFEWNSLESFSLGMTKLLHYTVGHHQPWLYPHHPLRAIWLNHLRECLQTGFLDKAWLKKLILRGLAHPYLWSMTQNFSYDILPLHMGYYWSRLQYKIGSDKRVKI